MKLRFWNSLTWVVRIKTTLAALTVVLMFLALVVSERKKILEDAADKNKDATHLAELNAIRKQQGPRAPSTELKQLLAACPKGPILAGAVWSDEEAKVFANDL